MKTLMDAQEVLKSLPHRYPFLLVDKVIEYTPGESIIGIKNVTINEPFFQGHFPGNPVMPGVLLLEALAQVCGVMCYQMANSNAGSVKADDYLYLFAGIDNARFKRLVIPGDQLKLSAKVQKHKQSIWKFGVEATVDGELACSADLVTAMKEKNRD